MKYEQLQDVIPANKFSECCGAKVYQPTEEWSQCLDCKEYCTTYEENI